MDLYLQNAQGEIHVELSWVSLHEEEFFDVNKQESRALTRSASVSEEDLRSIPIGPVVRKEKSIEFHSRRKKMRSRDLRGEAMYNNSDKYG